MGPASETLHKGDIRASSPHVRFTFESSKRRPGERSDTRVSFPFPHIAALMRASVTGLD